MTVRSLAPAYGPSSTPLLGSCTCGTTSCGRSQSSQLLADVDALRERLAVLRQPGTAPGALDEDGVKAERGQLGHARIVAHADLASGQDVVACGWVSLSGHSRRDVTSGPTGTPTVDYDARFPTREETPMADLSTTFTGIRFPNPFMLASAPPTESESNIRRAYDAGWGGVVTKTIGLHQVHNVRGPKTKFLRLEDGGTRKSMARFEHSTVMASWNWS